MSQKSPEQTPLPPESDKDKLRETVEMIGKLQKVLENMSDAEQQELASRLTTESQGRILEALKANIEANKNTDDKGQE